MSLLTTVASKYEDMIVAGSLSAFGGLAAYIYNNFRSNKPFNISAFIVNCVLAFFIGNVVGSFIPHSFEYRDGILMIAGFSTWPLLGLIEIVCERFALKFLNQKFGLELSDEDIQKANAKAESKQ